MINNKVCKFYQEGNCKKGENCSFIHDTNCINKIQTSSKDGHHINKNSILSELEHNNKPLKEAQDGLSKVNLKNKPKKLKKVNTESFEPSYLPPDMRIVIATPNTIYSSRDVIIAPGLFDSIMNTSEVYNKLLNEIDNSGTDLDKLWKSWHGDTHWIADDHLNWKKSCPTFNTIINRISSFFNIEVKATRLNFYKDNSEWKPFHFDAAAIDPKKAEKQNMTIGVSFGATREISFEHAITKTRISIPLCNGSTYGFSKTVNVEWRHGIFYNY